MKIMNNVNEVSQEYFESCNNVMCDDQNRCGYNRFISFPAYHKLHLFIYEVCYIYLNLNLNQEDGFYVWNESYGR